MNRYSSIIVASSIAIALLCILLYLSRSSRYVPMPSVEDKDEWGILDTYTGDVHWRTQAPTGLTYYRKISLDGAQEYSRFKTPQAHADGLLEDFLKRSEAIHSHDKTDSLSIEIILKDRRDAAQLIHEAIKERAERQRSDSLKNMLFPEEDIVYDTDPFN